MSTVSVVIPKKEWKKIDDTLERHVDMRYFNTVDQFGEQLEKVQIKGKKYYIGDVDKKLVEGMVELGFKKEVTKWKSYGKEFKRYIRQLESIQNA